MVQVQAVLAFDLVDRSAKAWMVRANVFCSYHCHKFGRHLPLRRNLRRDS
jgi:hypothetical protein